MSGCLAVGRKAAGSWPCTNATVSEHRKTWSKTSILLTHNVRFGVCLILGGGFGGDSVCEPSENHKQSFFLELAHQREPPPNLRGPNPE